MHFYPTAGIVTVVIWLFYKPVWITCSGAPSFYNVEKPFSFAITIILAQNSDYFRPYKQQQLMKCRSFEAFHIYVARCDWKLGKRRKFSGRSVTGDGK